MPCPVEARNNGDTERFLRSGEILLSLLLMSVKTFLVELIVLVCVSPLPISRNNHNNFVVGRFTFLFP